MEALVSCLTNSCKRAVTTTNLIRYIMLKESFKARVTYALICLLLIKMPNFIVNYIM